MSALLFRPDEYRAKLMSNWYPGWHIAAAWLLAVVVAGAIYFVPMTRLVDILIPAEITADAE